ncbi:MAG: type II toxin-antitoxin system RelE/ParE family toxin [Nitrososphaerota archaeon]|jgi:mRNA-degrading endonuclease RelE of RelBE toxin-antitoxin system|nr:type II toxin-antitoxin system RelE/ParE family toxin [Nitrososphaerota archaeon]
MKKTFKFLYNPEFIKQLNKLDKQTRVRIIKQLDFLDNAPFVGKHLTGRLSKSMSLRVGKYRIIYRVVLEESTIIIQTVELRKKVYDQ